MERYLGLDVHAQSCTLAVISAAGKKLKDVVIETNGQALIEAIRTIPGRKHLCLEEGTQSAWLYEILQPHVHELVVTTVPKSRGKKSDKADAYQRAEELLRGTIDRRVFKSPQTYARLRELARSHQTTVRDRVRVQARLIRYIVPGGSPLAARRFTEYADAASGSRSCRSRASGAHFLCTRSSTFSSSRSGRSKPSCSRSCPSTGWPRSCRPARDSDRSV